MMRKNKIVLVTGGSRGLGREMSVSLATKGVDVLLTYNPKEDACRRSGQYDSAYMPKGNLGLGII